MEATFGIFDPITDPIVDAFMESLKLIVIVSILFIFGLVALSGKFVVIPKPWGLIAGVGCIAGAVWLIWKGF